MSDAPRHAILNLGWLIVFLYATLYHTSLMYLTFSICVGSRRSMPDTRDIQSVKVMESSLKRSCAARLLSKIDRQQ